MARRWAGVYSRSTTDFGVRTILPPGCPGFYEVTVNQAHLGAEARGDGNLALALYSHKGAHGDGCRKAGIHDFLK
jgi:hypothetical protein